MVELFQDVQVAAAEHLTAAAGDLTLGELVSMLGRRADGLAEIWNHWGRTGPCCWRSRRVEPGLDRDIDLRARALILVVVDDHDAQALRGRHADGLALL